MPGIVRERSKSHQLYSLHMCARACEHNYRDQSQSWCAPHGEHPVTAKVISTPKRSKDVLVEEGGHWPSPTGQLLTWHLQNNRTIGVRRVFGCRGTITCNSAPPRQLFLVLLTILNKFRLLSCREKKEKKKHLVSSLSFENWTFKFDDVIETLITLGILIILTWLNRLTYINYRHLTK